MADNTAKVPENVPGKWYIDTNCIFCSASKSRSHGFSGVMEQPAPSSARTETTKKRIVVIRTIRPASANRVSPIRCS